MSRFYTKILVAAIILLLIASVMLLFRNDLLSLSSTNNNLSQQNVAENNAVSNSSQTFEERIFRAAMFIEGYKVEIKNEKNIIKEFENINVYGRPFIYKESQTTGKYPLKEIQLAIRPEEAMAGVTPDYGNFTHISLTDSLIQVNMFLSQEMLDDPQLGEIIIKNLYASVYKLTYKDATDAEVEDVANTAYDNLSSVQQIVIQKKLK